MEENNCEVEHFCLTCLENFSDLLEDFKLALLDYDEFDMEIIDKDIQEKIYHNIIKSVEDHSNHLDLYMPKEESFGLNSEGLKKYVEGVTWVIALNKVDEEAHLYGDIPDKYLK